MYINGRHHTPATYSRGTTPFPIEEEARWAPELDWTFWRKEKALDHAWI